MGRFSLASLLAFAAIGLVLSTFVARQIRAREIRSAEFHSQFVTESILRYELTPQELQFLTPMQGARYEEMATFVRQRIMRWPTVRVTIWLSDGEVVFSDDRTVVGKFFPLDDGAKRAFQTGSTVNTMGAAGSLDRSEQESGSKLIDTYVPVLMDQADPHSARVAVVEVAQDFAGVEAQVQRLIRTVSLTLLGALAFLYLVLIPIMVRVSRTLSHQNVKLTEQAGRLNEMLLEEQRGQAERKLLLDRTMRAAENERSRLAAHLHDGPIQRLAALGYRLERASKRLDRGETDGAKELMVRLHEDLAGETGRLRGIMSDLRPPILDQRGLTSALRDHVDSVRRETGLDCEVLAHLEGRLDPEIETVLYRVAQEALTNIVRHANAEHAKLSLSAHNGRVTLEVADDGVGFDPQYVAGIGGRDHFGLIAMRERVVTAGGTWEVDSRPGAGTRISAVLPRDEGNPP